MAFMAPAPDHAGEAYGGGMVSRSLSIPASYRSTAMSPTDSMTSLFSLEKLTECTTTATTTSSCNNGGATGAFSSRSATTSPTGSYWGQADMVQMLQTGATSGAQQQAELLGSGMVSSDWQQLLDTKSTSAGGFKYLAPVAMTPSRGGIMENARIIEMMAGRGGVPRSGTGKPGWGAMDVAGGITVDPAKGGLALQPGVGLATSHCLAQFTSDPAFAERAAKFSSFGSGKYAQIAPPLPATDAGKPRSRSAEGGGKFSKIPSSQNSAGKKSAPAVANEMEEKTKTAVASATAAAAAAAGTAAVAAAERSCDMDVDTCVRTMDDKSPPGAARVQPELEAIEGASLAAMDTTHELVEAPAAREPTNSCSVEQPASVQRGGHRSSSPAASPARSPSGSDDSDRRKRKNSPDRPDVDPKAMDVVDSKLKRWRGEKGENVSRTDKADDAKAKAERSSSDNSGDSSSPRAHKESSGSHKHHHKDLSKQDYIHVRARRGQATDSHSLAERVRREKISERMKYLQDLVPGCSKVTGKAVMLDEIINYVQSMQRQVESLSMKLASVNPGPAHARLDYSYDSVLNKELLQSRLSGSSTLGVSESTATFTMLQHQHQHQHQQPHQQHHHQQQHHQQHQHQQQEQGSSMHGGHGGLDFRAMGASSLDGYLRRANSAPINVSSGLTRVETFGDDVSQSIGWGGELQSIVNPIGFGHPSRFGSSILDGLHRTSAAQLPVGHMKVEL